MGQLAIATNQRGVNYMKDEETGDVLAKTCSKCGHWHFLHSFNNAKQGFVGKHSLCKPCHRDRDEGGRTRWV